MKRALLSFFVLGLAAIGAFGFTHENPLQRHAAITATASGAIAAPGPDERTRAEVREQLQRNGAGTYIGDILRERDSSLARWPDRRNRPLTVWIQPASAVTDWMPDYVNDVRSAFADWNAVALPVGFAFTHDSADADVHVTWIDHFDEPISGRTKWARDDDWWITDANIVLAVHHNQGETLPDDAMKAISLHEIGHLLGLDHTTDPTSIMAAKVRVRALSAKDRSTVRLIYTLPPGAVRG
jgi:hypothetical protein